MTESIPVLLTSAVQVSASHTALQDQLLRRQLTVDSIERWRRTAGVQAVVVCDGSGVDLSTDLDLSGGPGVAPVECLAFVNDVQRVMLQGKGFGEGQIVAYALAHSRWLLAAPVWAKCTGKLWVSNFPACLAGFRGGVAFDLRGMTALRSVDSRFYLVEAQVYRNRLSEAHEAVQDDQGYCLEHAFMDAMADRPVRDYVMLPVPRVMGVSGSDGLMHAPTWYWHAFWTLRNLGWRWLGHRPAPVIRSGRRPGSPPA